jgi:predicted PurR-regulated permease PerM
MPLTDRQRQTLAWLLTAVLLAGLVYALRSVLTPFVAAAVLSYVLAPGVAGLHARQVPRPIASILMILAAFGVLLILLLVLIPVVQKEFGLIRDQLPTLVATLTGTALPWLNEHLGLSLSLDPIAIRDWLRTQLAGSGEDILGAVMRYARSGGSAAIEVVSLMLLVPVLVYYLLVDWPRLTEHTRELVPRRWSAGLGSALHETDDLLGQYLRGQLLVMAALALWYAAALFFVGLDTWLPLGILTGLLAFVPYLGFGLSLIIALIAGMLHLGPLQGAVSVGAVYAIGQLLESYWLVPRLVGERIGLHPVAVVFALFAFGALLGFVGILLALPLAAIALVCLRRLRAAWLASDFYRQQS